VTDRIPTAGARILWNDDDDLKVSDICVVNYHDEDLQSGLAERHSDSNGADTAEWLTDVHPVANPLGLFGYVTFCCGFQSKAVALECLREFVQIEGCDVARKMLIGAESS
jgi:hypothetical protein